MFRFMRGMVKWSVIGGLGLLGLVALIGPGRVKAAYTSVRDSVRSEVDGLVPTRQALLEEMQALEEEYPERIAELRMQLTEVDRAVVANADDVRLAREVIALCRSDREALTARIESIGGDAVNVPAIEFRSERFDREEALDRAARIARTEAQYSERLSDLTSETEILRSERARIAEEVAKTEKEFADFRMEYRSLLREVDSLERKEDLVQMAESRRKNLEDVYSERAGSLVALKDRMERKRIELDAKLSGFHSPREGGEYEARARLKLLENDARSIETR